jgi:hypothetical protein
MPAAAGPAAVVVHPGHSLQAALDQAEEGAEVLLMPGAHRGQVGVVRRRRLTIRGISEGTQRAELWADGRHAQGKGTLVVPDGDIRIQNLVFRGARVPDLNGAGIRFERGRLEVSDCLFSDNQNGLLANNQSEAQLRLLRCRFEAAPVVEGSLPHLLYVGAIASLLVQDSHFEGGRRGHLLKSRARLNHIIDSRLVDGPDGQASYELEFPNGGTAVVVGCTLGQSRGTQNPAIVDFGAEARGRAADDLDHRLIMVRNTLLNDYPGGSWFVRVRQERLQRPAALSFVGNLYRGRGLGPPGFDDPALGNHHRALAR